MPAAWYKACSNLQTPSQQLTRRSQGSHCFKPLAADFPPVWAAQKCGTQSVRDCLPEVVMVGDSTPACVQATMFRTRSAWPRACRLACVALWAMRLPAAIGAALRSRTVCIAGDGGRASSLPELTCMSERRLLPIALLRTTKARRDTFIWLAKYCRKSA